MSEEEIQYITSKTTSRQNKKRKQQLLPPTSLYDMFPQMDQAIVEHCYKLEKGDFDRTVSMLLAFQIESQPDQQKQQNQGEAEDLSQYILEFQKLERNNEQQQELMKNEIEERQQEILQAPELNRYDSLKADVSSIWGDQPEFQQILDDCDQFYNETDFDNNKYLDAIGVDSNHIPTEFVHNIQQYMLEIINQEKQEFQNDYQQFPFLKEVEGEHPYLNQINNDNFLLLEANNVDSNKIFKCQQVKQNKIQKPKDNHSLVTRLCEEFPYLSFSKIQYAFDQLISYERCKIFLSTYYNEEYHPKEIKRPNNQQIQEQQQNQVQFTISDRYRKFTAQELRYKFQDNREKLKDVRNNYQVVDRCAGKYGKVAAGAKLNHFYESQRLKIEQLEYEGIKIFVALVVAEQSFQKIDLHGFYGGEIEELLDNVIEQIKIYKTRLKKNNLDVEFVVGRGLHSKNKKGVIGPIALQYFRSCNYQIVSQMEGRMIIKI